MWEFLSNILGGGALGVFLRIGNGFFEEWKAGRESSRKIEEARALAQIASDKAAWEAFTASQMSSAPPASTPSWAAAIITLFRPAITLLLLALVAAVFFTIAAEERSGMVSEIQFAAFNAIGWWFGDRMAVRMKKS